MELITKCNLLDATKKVNNSLMYNLSCCKESDIERAKLYSKIVWGDNNGMDTTQLRKYLYTKYECTIASCSNTTILSCGIDISQIGLPVSCATKPIINQIS